MKYIKYISLILIAIWAINKSNAQVHYQRMDTSTRDVEYNIIKSRINSNNQEIKLLSYNKKLLSNFDKESVKIKALQQAVISRKEEENFRLNHKIFLIEKARQNPINYGIIYK